MRHNGFRCFNGTLSEYVATLSKDTETIKKTKNLQVAVVAPANSLCFMGCGFDRAIAELFTSTGSDYRCFEAIIQQYTLRKFNGFVPPQSTNVIDLKEAFKDLIGNLHSSPLSSRIIHLVQTPTMVVPEKISPTAIFYCVWNTPLAVDKKFDTVILPAIGAAYGGIPIPIVARIMCGALGLYYMDFESPLNRGAAILLFLNKN